MWSLGLISYILLTGKHPFFDPDTTKMFIRVAAGDYQFDQKDWRNISVEAKVGLLLSGDLVWFRFFSFCIVVCTAVAVPPRSEDEVARSQWVGSSGE